MFNSHLLTTQASHTITRMLTAIKFVKSDVVQVCHAQGSLQMNDYLMTGTLPVAQVSLTEYMPAKPYFPDLTAGQNDCVWNVCTARVHLLKEHFFCSCMWTFDLASSCVSGP